jgi:hypothetical protein
VPAEPKPKTRRRKSGEDTRAAFPAAAGKIARNTSRPPRAYAAASIIMSETLDWLHIWHHHDAAVGSDQGNGFNTSQNHLSPRL